MSELTHRTVQTNGIEMHIAEQGDGPPVVLCHGFPELWYSWRHQLPALAAAGYHVIAPDQRGYGRTSRPDDVDSYDIIHLTDDMLGLLDALGEEQAVFVGHDWGGPVVWNLALRAPERVRAVAGLSVSFSPRAPMAPTELFKALFADNFFYILHFQTLGEADAELAADAEAFLRRFYFTISGDAPDDALLAMTGAPGPNLFERLSEPPGGEMPAWCTPADLAYFTSEFTRTGFTGGLNWYRNFDRNWEVTADLAEAKVEMPALFVAGSRDPVLIMAPPDNMDGWVTDLRGKVILDGIGHWTQQEDPDGVSAALREFLASL
jgi:pimeloyl-ACP methyl ester carboxylesterase